MKGAEKAAQGYASKLMNISESNKMASLQTPDLSSLGYQQTQRQMADATQALQGMGPEGAASVANLTQAGIQQQAETTQQQAEANFKRDEKVLTAAGDIERRRVEREAEMLKSQLTGAQMARADAQSAMASNIQGAFGSLSAGLGDTASSEDFFDWMKSRKNKSNSNSVDMSGLEALNGFGAKGESYFDFMKSMQNQ
jgi:hypothetical protein